MELFEIISIVFGTIGAVCIGIFTAPLLISTIKTKQTHNTSLTMFSILGAGALAFVISGIVSMVNATNVASSLAGLLPVTIANCMSFASSLTILIYKLRNRCKAKKSKLTEKEYCESLLKTK